MYDESNPADSFDLMTAYGHQRIGDYASARRGYPRIAEEIYGARWSSDRERVRLALALIAHAEEVTETAIEFYRAAGNGFPDARAALTVLCSAELYFFGRGRRRAKPRHQRARTGSHGG